MEVEKIIQDINSSALNKKSLDNVALDLRGVSDICSFQFICSGQNTRQTKAIADEILVSVKKKYGLTVFGTEGKQLGNWVLLDFGAIIIHVFLESLRDHYDLENLWPDVKKIKLNAN